MAKSSGEVPFSVLILTFAPFLRKVSAALSLPTYLIFFSNISVFPLYILRKRKLLRVSAATWSGVWALSSLALTSAFLRIKCRYKPPYPNPGFQAQLPETRCNNVPPFKPWYLWLISIPFAKNKSNSFKLFQRTKKYLVHLMGFLILLLKLTVSEGHLGKDF